ncbi:MAG: GNAT family N-acetyltransferase [Candidatus Micrarchaeaceae archaeon]
MNYVEVKHIGNRFYVETEHGDAELLYRIEENKMIIYKTFVPEEERHAGIAYQMTQKAIEYANENKLIVVPACEYAQHFMEKRASEEGQQHA